MALTRPLSAFIRPAETGGVLAPKHEQDRLAVQLAVDGRLVRRAGRDSPVEKADCLQSADRTPDPSLGQVQISTTGEFAAVDRKCARDPVRRGPEPTDEDGERIGGIAVAERG